MEFALAFLAGILCGIVGTDIFIKIKVHSDGNLRIDRSDPDGPYLFLELSNAIDVVSKKKHVLFDVIDKNYISRK